MLLELTRNETQTNLNSTKYNGTNNKIVAVPVFHITLRNISRFQLKLLPLDHSLTSEDHLIGNVHDNKSFIFLFFLLAV